VDAKPLIIAEGGLQADPVPIEHVYKVVEAIDAIAKQIGKSVPQIALNWLLRRPTVSRVTVGARNEEQLRQNLEAADWTLSPEQVAALDAVSETTPIYPYWHQHQFDIPLPVGGALAALGRANDNARR
jgi:diketogulonate reductase-like aldo/keto reductase